MWIFLYFLLQAHTQEECHNCTTILPEFTPFTQTMRRQNSCDRELGIGEGRVMNQQASSSIPVNRQYTLYRRDERSYEAVFNMNFAVGDPAPSSPQAVAQMEERARRCVAMIPPINGPDGKRLRLRVINDSDAQYGNTKPPRIDISVIRPPREGETFRGSAADFQESFQCGTIVHEMLHYAGLCDEYKEAIYTGVHDQSAACRPWGPADSIMSDGMLSSYNTSVGAPLSCDITGDENLWRFFASSSPLKSVALRQSFHSLQSGYWRSFGMPTNDNPPEDAMKVCCREIPGSAQNVTVTPDSRRVIMSRAENLNLEFESINYSVTNQGIPNFYKSRFQCNPSNAPVAVRAACERFNLHIKPQLLAAQDPRMDMMSCPHGSKSLAPTQYDIAPGQFRLSGNVIHMRSRGNGRPLLHGGHFNRVLAGYCSSTQPDGVAAAQYDQCANFSYKHSNPNCSQLPAACTGSDWVGGLVRGF